MPIPAAVVGGISLAGKITDTISNLFGSKPREGESECLPCNGVDKANILYDAFVKDARFHNEVRDKIRSELRLEGASLPEGCNALESPAKVAIAAEFMAKGANNCSVTGQSEKAIASIFPRWIAKAQAINSGGTYTENTNAKIFGTSILDRVVGQIGSLLNDPKPTPIGTLEVKTGQTVKGPGANTGIAGDVGIVSRSQPGALGLPPNLSGVSLGDVSVGSLQPIDEQTLTARVIPQIELPQSARKSNGSDMTILLVIIAVVVGIVIFKGK